MVDITDVPCQSCQRGYNGPHTCDIPDHCPCDRADQHTGSKPAETIDVSEVTVGPALPAWMDWAQHQSHQLMGGEAAFPNCKVCKWYEAHPDEEPPKPPTPGTFADPIYQLPSATGGNMGEIQFSPPAQGAVRITEESTLPEWFYNRLRQNGWLPEAKPKPWLHLTDDDRAMFKHECEAFLRAALRGGFKDYNPWKSEL